MAFYTTAIEASAKSVRKQAAAVPVHEERRCCQAWIQRGAGGKTQESSFPPAHGDGRKGQITSFLRSCVQDFFFNPLINERTSKVFKSGSEENQESRLGQQAGGNKLGERCKTGFFQGR